MKQEKYPKPKIKNVFHYFKSIRISMLISFSILIILALFIFLLISLNYTQDAIIRNSKDYTTQLVDQVNADIDSYIQYMKNISMLFTNNKDVTDYLFAEDPDPLEEEIMHNAILEQFRTLMKARTDIRNIGIYRSADRYIFNYNDVTFNVNAHLEMQEWYQKTLQAQGSTSLSSSHVQNIVKSQYSWVITLSNTLKNPVTQNQEGLLFIDLNYNTIRQLCDNISLGIKGYIFILDENGKIIYHPKQQLIYSDLQQECIEDVMALPKDENYFIKTDKTGQRLYTVSTSQNTGWTVVGVAYFSELNNTASQTRIWYILIALLLFLIAFLVSGILAREITRPIKKLKQAMSKVENGNFDTALVPEAEQNEIGSLSRSFNIMTRKIQDLIFQNTEEQRQKRKSELRALQAQINPHFLYNTLDSIVWMAELGKSQEVVLMTSSLAKLLRQSISNDEELVSIRQEIDYTRSYLTIQKSRYKDKLNFEINVSEEILEQKIVKLTLQPIVENAIYHGVKFKERKGTVWISGSMEDGKIMLAVTDDGVGMSAEQLVHIFEPKEEKKKSNGVGINNVQKRLHLYYGMEYGLTYESEEGMGTTVYICIPAGNKIEEDGGKAHEKEQI